MNDRKKYLFDVGNKIRNQFEVRRRHIGGMGVVYLCYDHINNNIEALKTFHYDLLKSEKTIERFIHEALIWIELGRHPNIVAAQSVEKIAGQPYILSECIVNSNTDSSLMGFLKGDPLNFNVAFSLVQQFCEGMIYANSKIPGIIHRDIKPQNILINNNFGLKICDFGLAKIHESNTLKQIFTNKQKVIKINETQQENILGTVAYMSPEQIEKQELGITSDIYSFGLVLYEMFTGKYPYSYETIDDCINNHLYKRPIRPRKIFGDIPLKLEKVILKCLEKKPKKRFLNFNDLKSAIIEIQPSSKNLLIDNFDSNDQGVVDIVNKVHSLFNLGFQEEALDFVNEEIKNYPNSPDLWSNKGVLLSRKDKKAEAIRAYDRALKIRPNYLRALSNKAACLCKQKKYNEALECTKKIIENDTTNVEAWINQGVAYIGIQNWDLAKESLSHANTLDPLIPNCWNSLATAVYPLGSLGDSKEALFPGDLNDSFNFEELKKSISYCLKALSIDQNHAFAEENLKIRFKYAIQQLPASFICEPILWELASREEYQEIFIKKLLGSGVVNLELHPKYLEEIRNSTINGLLHDTTVILQKIIYLIAERIIHSSFKVINMAIKDATLRFCLHFLNEKLIKIGLFELPIITAEALLKELNSLSEGEKFQLAKSMNQAGVVFRQMERYDESLKCYSISFPLYKSLGDLRFVGNTLYNFGCVYQYKNLNKDKKVAVKYFQKALSIFENISDNGGIKDARAKIQLLRDE